jgi:putative transposase
VCSWGRNLRIVALGLASRLDRRVGSASFQWTNLACEIICFTTDSQVSIRSCTAAELNAFTSAAVSACTSSDGNGVLGGSPDSTTGQTIWAWPQSADRLMAEGKDTAAVCRELGVAEATYHRWRNQFGRLKAEDAKRLKDFERENATLKRLLADAELEKAALKEIARHWKILGLGTPAGGRSSLPAGAGGQRTVRLPCRRATPHHQRHEPVSTTTEDPDAALRA